MYLTSIKLGDITSQVNYLYNLFTQFQSIVISYRHKFNNKLHIQCESYFIASESNSK